MSAHLGHEKNTLTVADKCFAHDLLTQPVMILPGVVHEGNSRINCFLSNLDRLTLRLNQSQAISTECQGGDCDAGSAQRSARNLTGVVLRLFHYLLSAPFFSELYSSFSTDATRGR